MSQADEVLWRTEKVKQTSERYRHESQADRGSSRPVSQADKVSQIDEVVRQTEKIKQTR